ncbi:putative membrane transport protein [Medicago truncatula]|uniref:Putative membrane transport protein n=1 Tax=Medicago truncatula TaxID=3880 RepID=A0A396HPW5_MEDTR|nr:putative membrane transport protein [Medicago truncatula]
MKCTLNRDRGSICKDKDPDVYYQYGIAYASLSMAASGLKGASTPFWTIIGIIAVRYIFLPISGILIVKGATHLGLVQVDPLYQFILLLQYALPPAMSIGTIAQLFGAGESECSVMMLWTYALASIAVTLWSTYFMWLVS